MCVVLIGTNSMHIIYNQNVQRAKERVGPVFGTSNKYKLHSEVLFSANFL